MKYLIIILMSFAFVSANDQTSKELIGKWKLVKQTKDGVEKEIKEDTYQVFEQDGVFQGIVGKKSRKGKWSLSSDNKELTVKVSVVTVKFAVEYFDEKKRIISSSTMGTLEYEKISE